MGIFATRTFENILLVFFLFKKCISNSICLNCNTQRQIHIGYLFFAFSNTRSYVNIHANSYKTQWFLQHLISTGIIYYMICKIIMSTDKTQTSTFCKVLPPLEKDYHESCHKTEHVQHMVPGAELLAEEMLLQAHHRTGTPVDLPRGSPRHSWPLD